MARVVILHFEDNNDANDFVADVSDGGSVTIAKGSNMEPMVIDMEASVLGVYMIPTQFCSCAHFSGPAYGAKFGLRICRKCCKPEHTSWQWPKNLYDKVVDIGHRWYFSFVTGGKDG